MNENRSVKKKEKKAVIIVLAVMAAIVLFSIPVLISSLGEGGSEETDETTRLIYFEEPNFEENIFEDEEYMGKNRLIYVINGPIGTFVDTSSESERDAQSRVVNFMFDFIDAQIMGNTDAYNACFSSEYIAKKGPHAPFTMQKLYDVSIEQYGSATASESESGGYDYIFILKYKILNNNGTLRNDMESMSERPLYLSVHEDADGKFAITAMRAR